jgi:hypothetical protein
MRTEQGPMEYGIVLPHNEIGTDPGAIAFAQGAEALGATHLLIYDHVMVPTRTGPAVGRTVPTTRTWRFTNRSPRSLIAAVTSKIDMMSAVLIPPQRQTVLVGKQAAEVAILSRTFPVGRRHWLEHRRIRSTNEVSTRAAHGNPNRSTGATLGELAFLHRQMAHRHRGEHQSAAEETIPVWFGGARAIMRCGELGDGWIRFKAQRRKPPSR